MCTTFLTALDRILKLLMDLVKTEMLTCGHRLDVPDVDYASGNEISAHTVIKAGLALKKPPKKKNRITHYFLGLSGLSGFYYLYLDLATVNGHKINIMQILIMFINLSNLWYVMTVANKY